jgi:hypothetical protein
MHSVAVKRIANAVLFQLGWFACVLGGNAFGLFATLAIIALHLALIGSWRTEGKLVIVVFALGSALDSALLKLGVFDFGDASLLTPLWLALLWALLATTLDHCLAWTARPWWLASVLGAIGGPLSYFAGSKLATVYLPLGFWPSMLILAAVWAIAFPCLHWLARYFRTSPIAKH